LIGEWRRIVGICSWRYEVAGVCRRWNQRVGVKTSIGFTCVKLLVTSGEQAIAGAGFLFERMFALGYMGYRMAFGWFFVAVVCGFVLAVD